MKRLPAVRERTEELERASLSTWATLAAESKGRDLHEEPDPLRTAFQSDRDRILHCASFRRLKHKSHLMLGDGHRRTRSTHALEVAQIARMLGRGLRLNEDLIEAIAFAHDIGNTAFGAAGEEALTMFTDGPFRPEEQSLRVVERLENAGTGLNLTWEVRDGILNHRPETPLPATVEGQAVRVAGAIASATYDVRDAIKNGVMAAADIPQSVIASFGDTEETRLGALVTDVVTESTDQPELTLSPRVAAALETLLDMLTRCLGSSVDVISERNRAVHCLSSIAVFEVQHPPEGADAVPEMVDTVAALTDAEALTAFRQRFLPSD